MGSKETADVVATLVASLEHLCAEDRALMIGAWKVLASTTLQVAAGDKPTDGQLAGEAVGLFMRVGGPPQGVYLAVVGGDAAGAALFMPSPTREGLRSLQNKLLIAHAKVSDFLDARWPSEPKN